ncbi:regulator of sigma D [Salirhabdus euzebyi]|uniref:Regulator of sigma D n=1 Tax=Salirhabdus euzebyi TaxID=394506 RepID=A0A841Q796_9BACI|nr:hypothetical protein [Salirhabdus euzebyi]MBB6454291.1 regulator of sigma D [Salirhabdus euzebyi]
MKLYTKLLLFFFLILFVKSIISDLTVGTAVQASPPTKEEHVEKNDHVQKDVSQSELDPLEEEIKPYEVVIRKIQGGDTVLSIAEELNTKISSIQTLLDDFKDLNPNTDPHQIKIDETYFFPVYKQ